MDVDSTETIYEYVPMIRFDSIEFSDWMND